VVGEAAELAGLTSCLEAVKKLPFVGCDDVVSSMADALA
jgi:hypothetical protein